LALLLIAIDGERKKTVQKIVEENKITLPVLLLLKEKVMDQYGVRAGSLRHSSSIKKGYWWGRSWGKGIGLHQKLGLA